jgi:hypothetical protein
MKREVSYPELLDEDFWESYEKEVLEELGWS